MDGVSLGNRALSTTHTRRPRRASSIASGDPAQRAPAITTSNRATLTKLGVSSGYSVAGRITTTDLVRSPASSSRAITRPSGSVAA